MLLLFLAICVVVGNAQNDCTVPNSLTVDGGTFSPAAGATVVENDKLKINCSPGLVADNDELTCIGGKFKPTIPTTNKIICEKGCTVTAIQGKRELRVPGTTVKIVNTGDVVRVGTTIQVECDADFNLDATAAAAVFKCESGSPGPSFNPTLPKCFAKCDVPATAPKNGQWEQQKGTKIPHGSALKALCSGNYAEKQGESYQFDCKDGSYTPVPTGIGCIRKCEISTLTSNAPDISTPIADAVEGDVVSVTCNNNKVAVPNSIECTPSGWSEKPQCKAAGTVTANECKDLNVILGSTGSATVDRAGLGGIVSVTCNPGYKLSHTAEYFCVRGNGGNAEWRPNGSLCKGVCPQLTVSNGQVVPTGKQEYTDGESVSISCEAGYQLPPQRAPRSTCMNGKWDFPNPRCYAVGGPMPDPNECSKPCGINYYCRKDAATGNESCEELRSADDEKERRCPAPDLWDPKAKQCCKWDYHENRSTTCV